MMAYNTKKRSEAIQARAMELVQIRPMSAEADGLINRAMDELKFDSRHDAFQYLRRVGFLGVDVGGEVLNNREAIATLMREFDCLKSTARKHVARAARRKRHPDWNPPQYGGQRPGAGRPREFIIDVVNGRAIVSKKMDAGIDLLQYTAAANWHEIEQAAIEEVLAQGGAINISGQYNCSKELANAAVWDDED